MAKSVLIVDDSRSMRELLRFTLEGSSYQVTEAADGEEALRKVSAQRFDLVITDLNMGAMDGLTLIKNIRSLPSYARVPLLMLTTESSAPKKEAAKQVGATGWLVKPFAPEKLLQTVARVMP